MSLERNVLEITEELVFLHPVHLRRLLLFFGVDFQLFLCRCGAQSQAYLSKRVKELAALVIGQLENHNKNQKWKYESDKRAGMCMNTLTHLRAVALAAEVRLSGPDGLSGGVAVDLSAVGYGRTIIIWENK